MEKRSMKDIREAEFEAFAQDIDTRLKEEQKLPPANIIVAGITGVGKSTLLNAVFGKEVAATGIGKPQTQMAKNYQSDDVPIRIWDTVGFELSEDGKRTYETLKAISDIIASKGSIKDNFDRIHAIWYCINAEAKRLQPPEVDFIAKLTKLGVPFIIVMTQCFRKKDNTLFEQEITKILTERGVNNLPIIQVLAQEVEFENPITGEQMVLPSKGLEELVNLTTDKMPEYLKTSFIAAQRVSKTEKHNVAIEEIRKFIDKAEAGFWERVPFARVLAANSHITTLLLRISQIYNTTILGEEDIKKICHESTSDCKKGSLKDFWVKKDNLNQELKEIMHKIEVDDTEIDFEERKKIAIVIAIDGFRFMKALEELWDSSTEDQLQNIDYLVSQLQSKMRSSQVLGFSNTKTSREVKH